MEAVKEIIHVKDNKLQMNLPSFFNDLDVEVIVFPSDSNRKKSFIPSDFYGIFNFSETSIMDDLKKLRQEWER